MGGLDTLGTRAVLTSGRRCPLCTGWRGLASILPGAGGAAVWTEPKALRAVTPAVPSIFLLTQVWPQNLRELGSKVGTYRKICVGSQVPLKSLQTAQRWTLALVPPQGLQSPPLQLACLCRCVSSDNERSSGQGPGPHYQGLPAAQRPPGAHPVPAAAQQRSTLQGSKRCRGTRPQEPLLVPERDGVISLHFHK